MSAPTGTESPSADAVPAPQLRHRLMAGFVGNVVEWYDFALFGYMAGIISPVFFPESSQTAGLIATYGIFAAGFLMRPLGSGLFGWLGDRVGRAQAMLLSVAMMAMPTVALGLLPTFAQAGLWSTVLLVLVRLVQGLSVGGEFSSSVTYLVETAPRDKRGLIGSWANIGAMVGMLLGAGAATAVTNYFDQQAVTDWAWRLPFLFGGAVGVAALASRWSLTGSGRYAAQDEAREATSPLLAAFTTNRRETLLALVFASGYAIVFYLSLVYMPEWISARTGMTRSTALMVNTVATVGIIPLLPLAGMVGDRLIRRKTWIALAFVVAGACVWPLYLWMAGSGALAAVAVTHAVLFAAFAVPLGSGPALFVELFPACDRLSGYSVAYNIGMGVVGGTTPMIATGLVSVTGWTTAPALYMIVGALAAVTALLMMTDRSRAPLR